jgi:S1-C subfamily serine protease
MTHLSASDFGLALSNAAADAVERAGAVTVLVNARRRRPLSGLLYAADLVLTASHGVEREEDIQILLPDGSETSAVLAGRDPGTDLALLRLPGAVQVAAAQPAAQGARVGMLVAAVGRPSREGIQASLGMINAAGSGLRTQGGVLAQYLVTDAVPLPGFSGGPLVDLAGGILGVNTSGLARGAALVIPAGAAWQAAATLAQYGHVRRGYLGIRSQVVELPAGALAGQTTGLLVVGVEPDGPAGGALMVGDIITGLDGQPVADHDDLLARLSGEVVGKEAAVAVLRGGQPQVIAIRVGERS